MKRLLVVQQYRPPGSFQDRQRGARYASLMREIGFEPTYAGRHVRPALQDARHPLGIALATTRPVTAWNWLLYRAVTPFTDAQIVRLASKADVVLFLKVDAPALVQRIRRASSARLVFDLADRIWLDGAGQVRHDVVEMLSSVDAITVDNSYGHAFASRLGPPVHMWPSAAYVEEFDLQRARSRRGRDGKVVVGWIGSHSTAANLMPIVGTLADLLRSRPEVELRLYGIPANHEVVRRLLGLRVKTWAMYDTEEMIAGVLDMDVGLYPMPDNDDAAMHGTTKGVIYMAGGAVVVASPVADVAKLVEHGRTGLHARSAQEWQDELLRAVSDAPLRRAIQGAALVKVRERNSLRACFASMKPALLS